MKIRKGPLPGRAAARSARTGAGEADGRRDGALALRPTATLAARPALQAGAATITTCALEMAPLRARFGVPPAGPGGDDDLAVVIDRDVEVRAHLLRLLLPTGGPGLDTEADTGVSADLLGRLQAQYGEMGEAHLAALALRRGVRDSRRVLGRSLRTLMGRLGRAARAEIAALPEGSPERARLEEDFAEVEAREAALREAQSRRGAAAAAETADLREEEAAQARHDRLVAVLGALRAGRPVSRAEVTDAAETLAATEAAEAATEPTPADRRDHAR